MWDWVSNHHDDLQVLGPVATVIAAVIAAVVAVAVTGALGVAQWRIAREQKNIAFDKLKLDLFERRYAVYVAAIRLSGFFIISMKRIPYEEFGELQYTIQQATFLFPRHVTRITDAILRLSYEWEGLTTFDADLPKQVSDAARARWERRRPEVLEEMLVWREQLTGAFVPELSFRQLTRT